MRAVIVQNGRPTLVTRPAPKPQSDEVLVRVAATALNRADLLQVKGLYPPPSGASDVLGLEFAGEIIGLGEEVRHLQVGQRVMALVAGGGYAEEAVVNAHHVMPVPPNLTLVEAAAIPEAFLTAYSNLIEIGRLSAGEVALIHAGASGVGLAAIQLAQQVGAKVAVTASRAKHAICRQYGAQLTIDYKTENFAERVIQAYGGVDVILDTIGAPYWQDNIRCLNRWGRLVYIGLMGGAEGQIHFGAFLQKCLTVAGSTLRNRETERKTALIQTFWSYSESLFANGTLKPVIDSVFPLADVQHAHQLMADNRNAGKIILTLA